MTRIRRHIFRWCATGLAASCIIMVLRPSVKDAQTTDNRLTPPLVSHRMAYRDKDTAGSRNDAITTAFRVKSPAALGNTDATGMRRATDQAGSAISPPTAEGTPVSGDVVDRMSAEEDIELSADSAARAVQLNDDVRLPAALMPQGQDDLPPAVAAAAVEIGNSFYRKLQNRSAAHQKPPESSNNVTYSTMVPKGPESPNLSQTAGQQPPSFQVPDTAEDLTLIPNTPDTEQIRKQADEQFRALYGDEKFIRQTVSSAIEVRLPLRPDSP